MKLFWRLLENLAGPAAVEPQMQIKCLKGWFSDLLVRQRSLMEFLAKSASATHRLVPLQVSQFLADFAPKKTSRETRLWKVSRENGVRSRMRRVISGAGARRSG